MSFQALPRPEDGWVPVRGPLPPPKTKFITPMEVLAPRKMRSASSSGWQTPAERKPPVHSGNKQVGCLLYMVFVYRSISVFVLVQVNSFLEGCSKQLH